MIAIHQMWPNYKEQGTPVDEGFVKDLGHSLAIRTPGIRGLYNRSMSGGVTPMNKKAIKGAAAVINNRARQQL
jgi:hypothetical protein